MICSEEKNKFSNLQKTILKQKKHHAFPYVCKALETALFGSAEEWQSVRDEILQMKRDRHAQS